MPDAERQAGLPRDVMTPGGGEELREQVKELVSQLAVVLRSGAGGQPLSEKLKATAVTVLTSKSQVSAGRWARVSAVRSNVGSNTFLSFEMDSHNTHHGRVFSESCPLRLHACQEAETAKDVIAASLQDPAPFLERCDALRARGYASTIMLAAAVC